ncbi:outer membrane beta-barrel family protein [Pedobacter duraquae]|uniref:Outer membrane receptor protein involved in Fe transport n=1 Tax=Pedobacter duraquae TaxID=425511 RepID=A0A4R6IFM8_9SPHI|nr:outer membrane beta-barrel family protein [Pedobacter duraquae]TDO19725.1 outer membrane receptor protein involved in Fe transport [Pedobacter duraquae]
MSKNYLCLLALLVLLFSFNFPVVLAQDKMVRIEGHVIDEHSRPLDQILVELLNPGDSTVLKIALTNAEGMYFFEKIKVGSYQISISGLGYKRFVGTAFDANSTSATQNRSDIRLEAISKQLNEVSIVSTKPLIERRMDKIVVNVENASRFTGNSVMDVLEKSPGITVNDDGITMSGKSGVQILIDGRQTYLSQDALTALLQGMQSSEVEVIELINKPSAKYDAAGTAGIINIRTKRDKRSGANGNVNIGAGYGETSKYNGGASLNYRGGKLNAFADYNYSDYGVEGFLNLNRVVRYAGATTTYLQHTGYHDRKTNHAYKAGLDYRLNARHAIGFLYNGYLNGSASPDNPSNTAIQTIDGLNTIVGTTRVANQNLQRFHNNSFNLNYIGKLDTLGQELIIDLVYGTYYGKENDQRKVDTVYNLKSGLYFVRNSTLSDINIKTVKVNYTYPLSKTTTLQMGLKSSWVVTDNNLQYLKSLGDELHFQSVGLFSNRFVYDENINAAFLDYAGQYGGLGIQFGLRAEQTNASARLINVSDRNYKYIDLFPSLALSYKLNDRNDLSLSYSRRIDRPDYDSLNPALREFDNKTFWKGNEFLTPQYSNGVEFSHSFKGVLITSVEYTVTKDAMIGVTEQDDATGRTYVIKRNLNTVKNYSTNLYAGFTLLKWWQINNNLNVYHSDFNYTYNNNDYHGGQTSVNLNLSNSFNLPGGIVTELAFVYQSGLTYGLDKINYFSFIDAGLKKAFLNKKLMIRASLNDIFNKRIINGVTRYQGIDLSFNQKRESRIARLSMSYAFGNSTVKQASRRANAAEQEAGRLKQ